MKINLAIKGLEIKENDGIANIDEVKIEAELTVEELISMISKFQKPEVVGRSPKINIGEAFSMAFNNRKRLIERITRLSQTPTKFDSSPNIDIKAAIETNRKLHDMIVNGSSKNRALFNMSAEDRKEFFEMLTKDINRAKNLGLIPSKDDMVNMKTKSMTKLFDQVGNTLGIVPIGKKPTGDGKDFPSFLEFLNILGFDEEDFDYPSEKDEDDTADEHECDCSKCIAKNMCEKSKSPVNTKLHEIKSADDMFNDIIMNNIVVDSDATIVEISVGSSNAIELIMERSDYFKQNLSFIPFIKLIEFLESHKILHAYDLSKEFILASKDYMSSKNKK